MKRKVMKRMFLGEISAVDVPAQPGAVVSMIKALDMCKLAPSKGESEKDYMDRFMGDAGMNSEYPDQKQRAAVAHSMFREKMKKAADEATFVQVFLQDGDIAALVPSAVERASLAKRLFSEKEREHDAKTGAAMEGGGFPIENEQDLKNAIQAFGRAKDKAGAAKHIRARASALGLSESLPKEGELASLSKGNHEASTDAADAAESTMTAEEKAAFEKAAQELAELKKANARLTKLSELSDVQKAHVAKLDDEGKDKFLSLDTKGREVEMTKALEKDRVVYTSEDGQEFRKSDDPRLVAMAKHLDAERQARRDSEKQLREENLAKRASELKHLPGTDESKVSLLEAIDALPVEKRKGALEMLKAQDAANATGFQTRGVRGEPKSGSPESEIDALAKSMREKNPKLTEAQAMVKALETPEGRALYAKHIGA